MTGVTPSIRLNLPAYDVPGWDTLLNNNAYILDSLIQRVNTVVGYIGLWANNTAYTVGQTVTDSADSSLWQCAVNNVSAISGTFLADRTATPANWTNVTAASSSAAASAVAAAASATTASAAATATAANAASAAANAAIAAASESAAVAAVTATSFGVRNKIRNPMFTVNQRGVGPFTVNNTYTADGWFMTFGNDTQSVSLVTATDADKTAVGDDDITTFLQSVAVNTGIGTTAEVLLTHPIEDVRSLSGKTVVLSFWARATAGTPKLGYYFTEVMGTGGSPSGNISLTGATVTLSTTWTRYVSAPITLASIVGKTLGSNNDSALSVIFGQSVQGISAITLHMPGISRQGYTLQLWGVQLEVGTDASNLEKLPKSFETIRCQRVYQIGVSKLHSYGAAGANAGFTQSLPVQMRGTPTIVYTAGTQTNCTAGTVIAVDNQTVQVSATVTALSTVVSDGTFTASAEL